MKTFKVVDLIVQVLLITGGIIYTISSINKTGPGSFDAYIAVGAWQIISYSIHYFFLTPTIFQLHRTNYGKMALVILIPGFVLFISLLLKVTATAPFLTIYLIVLMIFFPFLAIYYLLTCWKEYRIMIKRELIHLK